MIKKQIKAEAERFNGAGKAFVHSEWYAGSGVETLIAGDITGQLYCVACTLMRISEITHQSFGDTLNVVKLMGTATGEKEQITEGRKESESYEDLLKRQAEEAAERKYGRELKAAKDEAERNKCEAIEYKVIIRRLQEKVESTRKAGNDRAAELQREIKGINAEIQTLREELLRYALSD